MASIYGLRSTEYPLFNKKITVECDNQVLTWLYRAKNLNAQTARYIEFFNNFRFEFELIKIKEFVDCDFLSRFLTADELKTS